MIDVGGAGGTTSIGGYTIDSLVVPRDDNNDGVIDGELVFTNVPIFVLDIAPGIDGILGMNLFNPAAEMLYDPWDPDADGPAGPSLQFTFTTGDRVGVDGDSVMLLNQLFPMFAGSIGGQSLPGLDLNAAPTIAADSAAVSTDEGSPAVNTGTYSDANGDTIQLAASVGTVSWSDLTGTWSWSLPTTDGDAAPIEVTITATDGRGGVQSTTFTYTVKDVAPTLGLSGNNQVNERTPYALTLGAVADPGTDTVTGFQIQWGDGTTSGFIAGSPTGRTFTHAYAAAGTRTITVDLYDEDAAPHAAAGSKVVSVLDTAPDLTVSLARTGVPAPGRVNAFYLTVTNVGTSVSTGAYVTIQLPAGMQFVAVGSTPGWQYVGPRKFRLAVGTLDPNESIRVVLRARIMPAIAPGTVLTTTARVGDDGLNGPDANPVNNVARLSMRVRRV